MRFLTLIAVLLASQSMGATCPDHAKFGRKCFNNANAPTELVFRLFVQSIFADSLHYLDDLENVDDEEDHAGLHKVKAGLTPEMRSADVAHYFATRYLDIEKEVEELSKKTICIDRKPRYEGAENFVIFNQLEEVSLNIYQKHLLLARSDLQASGLFDLDKALNEYPGQFIASFFDHEKGHDGSEKGIYEVAVDLCKGPWGQSFGSGESLNEN